MRSAVLRIFSTWILQSQTQPSQEHQEEAAKKTLADSQKPCLDLQEEEAGPAALPLGLHGLGAGPHHGGDVGRGAVAQVAQASQKWSSSSNLKCSAQATIQKRIQFKFVTSIFGFNCKRIISLNYYYFKPFLHWMISLHFW